jgi:hypothetical protein
MLWPGRVRRTWQNCWWAHRSTGGRDEQRWLELITRAVQSEEEFKSEGDRGSEGQGCLEAFIGGRGSTREGWPRR